MPSVLLQKVRNDRERAYLVSTRSPWRLGPFTAAECEAWARLCEDGELCRLLGLMLRPCWPSCAGLLLELAEDEPARLRLVDEWADAADRLYALAESFDNDSATRLDAPEELPAPLVRIAE